MRVSRFWLRFWILASLFCRALMAETTLFYTANRQGEIDPCGCQTGQIGGLDRMAQFILDFKPKSDTLFLDSGDSFFAFKTLNSQTKGQDLEKARLIAKAYQEMALTVFAPGEKDFAGGIPFLRELASISGALFVSSNLVDSKNQPLFERTQIIKRGGIRFGLFALAGPEAFKRVPGVGVLDPIKTARQLVAELRKKSDVIVLLSHLGLAADRRLKKFGIDYIFGSHSLDSLAEPEKLGNLHIFQAYIEGQQIGVLSLDKFGKLKKHGLYDLDEKYVKENQVSRDMKRFRDGKRVITSKKNRSKKKKEKPPGFVAHAYHCRSCHSAQYDFWEKTKHASAYLVLYARNQHFDPECISCHSIGFEEPGGFKKIAHPIRLKKKKSGAFIETLMKEVFKKDPGKGKLDSRKDPKRYHVLHQEYSRQIKNLEEQKQIEALYIGVQCEHCHGSQVGHPGITHVRGPVKRKVCLSCHAPPNADKLDFKTALPKIACPKLGG